MSISSPRVVHIIESLKSGGAEALVIALTRGLRTAGIDARLISIYADGLTDGERADLGVPLTTVGRRSRADVGFFPRLRSALRAERPDVAHGHLSGGKYAGRFAAILEGVPSIVYTEHGDENVAPIPFLIDRFLHAKTSSFVTFSPEHRERVARVSWIPKEKIVVIPNGVAEPPHGDRAALRAELGIPVDAFVFYLPARFAVVKNQPLLLRALALGAREHPNWHVALAGTGVTEGELHALARQLGIEDRVHFLGYRTDAARIFAAADAMALPSLDERMPLALGEAMRAGVPAATTPWFGVDAYVRDGETGFVAQDFSPEGLAGAMARLAAAPNVRTVAANAKAFADASFSMEACVREHVALYERLGARR